uniref:Uncharacterized protein n=1 Tax=Glossina austeni TaxID=7395 RepID=A0A1A9V857_GLOAU
MVTGKNTTDDVDKTACSNCNHGRRQLINMQQSIREIEAKVFIQKGWQVSFAIILSHFLMCSAMTTFYRRTMRLESFPLVGCQLINTNYSKRAVDNQQQQQRREIIIIIIVIIDFCLLSASITSTTITSATTTLQKLYEKTEK